MKKAVLLLTCAFASTVAVTEAADQAVFTTDSEFNGTNYHVIVFERDLVDQPIWKSTDEFPPLSPQRAQILVRARLLELFPDLSGWESRKLSLIRVGTPGNWIYVVRMQPSIATRMIGR